MPVDGTEACRRLSKSCPFSGSKGCFGRVKGQRLTAQRAAFIG
ncbi:hypothetical protein HMPREF9135_2309 [Segatella baroniae F0067]|uniref:Uncharacterized protein n=1 Tax=Segatella baroniae F0067 TaxID=1115809 RepID=U2QE45_9BACT|nr:hypothetical protein HMPREF9135_2309 [Segatella baroniae F0067]